MYLFGRSQEKENYLVFSQTCRLNFLISIKVLLALLTKSLSANKLISAQGGFLIV